ncbi:MAG: biotin carboxylase [Leptospiraceae bacterium]|nr:biotin carboxylase [Leptospiraceae bacterium]MCP5494147.1 biotin carboxylase [Leptospiraceae bacterium]
MLDNNNQIVKFHESDFGWIRSYRLDSIKCLIVCRGPVRKEAMDVFDSIGIKEYGILLSEKDSIVYSYALAPELRGFRFQNNIHRVPDYMGSGKEEKTQRIGEIIAIAKNNGYTHIFAGYGFMAEDFEFIKAIEDSGLTFMGPSSSVAMHVGAKDEAKKLARKLGLSVTPGVDMVSANALVRKAKNQDGLVKIAGDNGINFQYDPSKEIIDNAEDLLQLSYEKKIDIVSINDLQTEAELQCLEIWKDFPAKRIRFKYIGGGGGKGQRVIKEKNEIRGAVMEILAESKVTGIGSNRNFLIELNIENTRHNEIQIIGNGDWCLSLGGRDCSLQMHEQKLLEISLTQELLHQELEGISGHRAEVLKADLQALTEMEEEAERLGAAVHLNSVSTFESIVEGTNHFFMEVNTRIQVEHRVTEMVYKLKFTNPENPSEYFIVESLVEAMALLSLHGQRLPKPERIQRNLSGAEARINATNQSLQPHAGGIILNWSPPLPYEIRDDQGIGIRNHDTGLFIRYRLAGAYDSNIALIVSYGKSRFENLDRLRDILKRTVLRGNDLQTNMPVHYGLINWIIGKDVMFKPSTRFMLAYLAGIGSLESKIKDIDIEVIWEEVFKNVKKHNPEHAKVLSKKLTLITRPIRLILSSPHLLGGFLGFHHNKAWEIIDYKVKFIKNPVLILNDLYAYLNLESDDSKDACHQIWDHDLTILNNGLDFYNDLERISGLKESFGFWDDKFKKDQNPVPDKINNDLWQKCRGAHEGHQLGMDILKVIPRVGSISSFIKLDIDGSLNEVVPDVFKDSAPLIKFLSPPPKAKSDEIVAPMGGVYYSKESPDSPQLIKTGEHFKAGQPLFIIEVMKMFNKISAPFDGTIVKNFMEDSDGKVIAKGQTLFKVEPDEPIVEESLQEIEERRKNASLAILLE